MSVLTKENGGREGEGRGRGRKRRRGRREKGKTKNIRKDGETYIVKAVLGVQHEGTERARTL